MGVSEYGFGGTFIHINPHVNENKVPLGRFHPEGFQAISHEKNWEALAVRPYLWAKFIWVFADFQSAIRAEKEMME